MTAPTAAHADAVSLARQYILTTLNTGRNWNDVLQVLKRRHGYDGPYATVAITDTVLELERDGQVFYDPQDGIGFRAVQPEDPPPAPLDQVAEAVLALDWNPRDTRLAGGRSIREAQQEIGLYRHCDVYDAMHSRLKGRELKASIVYWTRISTDVQRCLCGCGTTVTGSTFTSGHDGRFRGWLQSGILTGARNAATARVPAFTSARTARHRLELCITYLEQLGHPKLAEQLLRDVTVHLPPSLEQTFLDRAEHLDTLPAPATPVERQHLETDLVAAYRTWLPYPLPQKHLEWPITAGDELLRADLLDIRRQRIVEAKASAAFGPVRDALLQADGYRHAANRYTDVAVDHIAVLLPHRPGHFTLEYLTTRLPELGLAVTLIYPENDQFAEELFG